MVQCVLLNSRTRFLQGAPRPAHPPPNMVTASAVVPEPAPAPALKRLSGTPVAAAAGPPEQPPLVEGTEEWRRHLPVTDIHPHDEGTKDAWIPR